MRALFTVALIVSAFVLGAQAERMFGITVFWSPEVERTEAVRSADGSAMDTSEASGESVAPPETRVVIPPERLTDSQKAMLRSLGVDPESITITQETVACAEGSVGTARMVEIQGGATPTFSEGLKLLACYRR